MPDNLRQRLRRFWLGLLTLTGWKQAGFFIPYRYAAGVEALDYPALEPVFAAAAGRMGGVLDAIDSHAGAFAAMQGGGAAPRFQQQWYPRLDACAAYALVRRESPAQIVEIGSGHSTRFLARAVADAGLATRITCMDPAPRATIAQLKVKHLACVLAQADPSLFEGLQAGDFVFVDSSHIAMPGTDVDRVVLDILPRLKPGVLVHFHDIFLPDAYPPELAQWAYNEQALVGALLQGGAWELVFSSHYVQSRMATRVATSVVASLPLPGGAIEGSVWLRKRRDVECPGPRTNRALLRGGE